MDKSSALHGIYIVPHLYEMFVDNTMFCLKLLRQSDQEMVDGEQKYHIYY